MTARINLSAHLFAWKCARTVWKGLLLFTTYLLSHRISAFLSTELISIVCSLANKQIVSRRVREKKCARRLEKIQVVQTTNEWSSQPHRLGLISYSCSSRNFLKILLVQMSKQGKKPIIDDFSSDELYFIVTKQLWILKCWHVRMYLDLRLVDSITSLYY